jgi:hypothetical protein
MKGRDHSEDLIVDGRKILEWILGKQGMKMRTGFIRIVIASSGGCCEHGNEQMSSIKGGEFLG